MQYLLFGSNREEVFLNFLAGPQPPNLVTVRELVRRQLDRRKYPHTACAKGLQQRTVLELPGDSWLDLMAIKPLIEPSAHRSMACRQ